MEELEFIKNRKKNGAQRKNKAWVWNSQRIVISVLGVGRYIILVLLQLYLQGLLRNVFISVPFSYRVAADM